MQKIILMTSLFLIGIQFLNAQNFIPAMDRYSHKKPAYIHLQDGTVIEGILKDVDRKKGLVKSIELQDPADHKGKIKPEQIRFMYLPPSGFEKMTVWTENATNANKWETSNLDKDIIEKGYVYLERTNVLLGKETHALMLQVINPTFNTSFSVYEDPNSPRTTSVGVGPLTVAGGVPKSVFIRRIGDEVAFELKKKHYRDEFERLFGDCEEVMKTYGEKPQWDEFEAHLWMYTQCQ